MSVSSSGKQNHRKKIARAESSPAVGEPMEQASQAANQPSAAPDNHKRNRSLWWFTIALVVVAFAWLCLWFFYLRFYESTDDAYANGNMISINAAISGSVVAFFADNTDLVTEGQLLILLDSTKYQIEYDKALAALASTVLQVRQLYDTVDARRANVESSRTVLEKARYDFENRSALIESKAVSNEEFTHAKDDLYVAEQSLVQAESELKVAIDAAGNTPLEQHPNIEQAIAGVREAYYNLEHCPSMRRQPVMWPKGLWMWAQAVAPALPRWP